MAIQNQRVRVFAKGNSIQIADSVFAIDGELEAVAGNGPANVIVRLVRSRQRVLCIPYHDIYKEDNINTWASTRASTVTLLNALFNHTNPSDYADKSDTTASISSINSEITNIKNTLKVDGDRGIYKDPDNASQANVRLVTNSSLVVAASDKTRIDIGEASPGVIDFIVNSNTNTGSDTAVTALTISGDAANAKASVSLSANANLTGFNLGKLSDVSINSPSTGQVLKYDGSGWVNGTDASGTTLPTGGAVDTFLQKNSGTNYDLKWSAYRMPPSDGTSGQFISTNGSGTLSFQSLTSGNDNATISVDNGDLKIEVQPTYIYETVKNVTAGTLSKGTPVKVTGAVGNTPEVIAADAATNYPAHFILLEDISADSTGGAISHGHINQVSVPDASIYSEGDAVYLGASGGWTLTKPTGTNQIQKLGVILKVDTVSDTISGIVQGAGRTNDIPNIPQGQAWIGNASGVATATTLADVATSGAYSDLSGTPSIPVSGVDFDPVGTDNSTNATVGSTASDVLKFAAGQVLGGFDAGADKLVFWDDSAGKLTYATIGTNLTMTDTTLAASGGGGSANMSQTFSAPTSVGEFQDGARLVTGAYGTAPSATAGTLVNFGNTNVSAVGAQSVSAAATGMLTVVTDAASGDELLVEGVVKMSSNTGWSTAKKGAALYMSTTAGRVTTTAPSTAGEFVRVVGHVVDATNSTIYFKPDNTWLEL